MNTAVTRTLYLMCAVMALSLLLVGSLYGFWAACSYAAGIALVAWGYWIWFAARPRVVCVPVHTLTGIYLYREVV